MAERTRDCDPTTTGPGGTWLARQHSHPIRRPARLSSVGSNRAPCGITLRGSASAERRIRADPATTARTRTVEGSPGVRRQQDSVPIPAPVPKGAAQRLITSRWCRDGRRGGHSFGRCRAVDAARARYAGVGPIALHRPAGPLPAEAETVGRKSWSSTMLNQHLNRFPVRLSWWCLGVAGRLGRRPGPSGRRLQVSCRLPRGGPRRGPGRSGG